MDNFAAPMALGMIMARRQGLKESRHITTAGLSMGLAGMPVGMVFAESQIRRFRKAEQTGKATTDGSGGSDGSDGSGGGEVISQPPDPSGTSAELIEAIHASREDARKDQAAMTASIMGKIDENQKATLDAQTRIEDLLKAINKTLAGGK